MEISQVIVELIRNVFNREMTRSDVSRENVRKAIANMADAYKPDSNWMYAWDPKPADYNDANHRCAYLHKYAMLHTGLVCEHLQSAFRMYSVKKAVESLNSLNLCSLGGGPGTDIVALLFVLGQEFGCIECDVKIVDSCSGWKSVFESVTSELRTGRYGNNIGKVVSSSYFRANLLDPLSMSYDVHESISKADITTMIKFVSAAACNRTREMIKEIFHIMKPGSLLLFIDNASGGFYEGVDEEARDYGLESVFGPVKHCDFEDASFSRTLYGHLSQSKTRVTAEMWKKPLTLSAKVFEPSHSRPSRGVSVKFRGGGYVNKAQGGDTVDSPNIRLQNERSDEDNEVREKCCTIM